MSIENKRLKNGYTQVCIWPGVLLVPKDEHPDPELYFCELIKEQFGVRVQFLESVKTFPDVDESGDPIEGTGGRNDIVFAVHKEDIKRFAIPRLVAGISWVEDVMSLNNSTHRLYPSRFRFYCGWNFRAISGGLSDESN